MKPSNIIVATATTSSSEDDFGRVKIKAEDLFDTTEPILCLGEFAIVKDDKVFVDISQGYESPVIVGVLKEKSSDFDIQVFHSSDSNKSKWSKLRVKQSKVSLETSDKVSITIDSGNISINSASGKSVTINNHLQVK